MKPSNASRLSRREFLKLALIASGGLLASCARIITPSESTSDVTAFPSPTATATQAPTLVPTSTPPSTLTPTPTSAPTSTATPEPTRAEQKIKNIIILIEENHAFDSFFSEFPGADGKFGPRECPINVTDYLADMMAPNTPYVCSYHEEQVPNYWKMARSFTLCDNYFCDVKAPSCPNFLMLGTAQSPIMEDPPTPWRCPDYCIDIPSFADVLDEKGLTWRDYGGNNAVIKSLQGRSEISYHLSEFFEDAEHGTLQNFMWINTFMLGGNKTSGHPPSNICDAENYAVDILNAVMHSPQWESTLLFIVWDEWGGFYDHVIPPPVEYLPDGTDFRYGGRVPCILISPYAKQGFVSHTLYSHVSLLKTAEVIFNLRSLNERDANANSLLDCMDFNQQPLAPIEIWKHPCEE